MSNCLDGVLPNRNRETLSGGYETFVFMVKSLYLKHVSDISIILSVPPLDIFCWVCWSLQLHTQTHLFISQSASNMVHNQLLTNKVNDNTNVLQIVCATIVALIALSFDLFPHQPGRRERTDIAWTSWMLKQLFGISKSSKREELRKAETMRGRKRRRKRELRKLSNCTGSLHPKQYFFVSIYIYSICTMQ